METFKNFANERLCVAISGGVDSVALLHFMKSREKEDGFSLLAVHCEHGIRGKESLSDKKFVETLCKEWNVPLTVFQEDCIEKAARDKCSLETAAREFRRSAFSQMLISGKADKIVTAHHAYDEAETVLFRLARGTSLSGVFGMRETDGNILRPFLGKTKKEILAYAKAHGLEWREDSTNQETDATRNKLRLEILPRLEEAVPGAIENIARFALLAAEDDGYLMCNAQKLLKEKDGEILLAFSQEKPLFNRACVLAFKKMGVEKDYTSAHVNAVFRLQKSERGAKLDLPCNLLAIREDGYIVLRIASKNVEAEWIPPSEKPFSKDGFDGGRYAVNIYSTPKNAESEYPVLRIDGEKIPADAVFRFRREGDKMERFGGVGKSLKKLFNEKKIPVLEREALPLIASAVSGEVYAVCGVEISEKVKISQETKATLYVYLERKK